MKFVAALLPFLATAFAAKPFELTELRADSELGMKVLSKARALEEGQWMNTWISGYSLKFQGCHHISQWNDQAEGEDDVRIATKRLVRFRLCPSDYCSADSARGCNSQYGDYIIDMETYLEAFFEAKQNYQSFQCEYLQNYACGCGDADDQQYCLWQCMLDHDMGGICMENPYGDDNNRDNFDISDYMQCGQANLQNNNGNNNGNNGNNNQYGDNWDGSYYIGPYCASQGGAIYMGVFTDDTCTSFADNSAGRTTFYSLTGSDLPYGKANVVDMDCLSCKEPAENNNGGNDAQDADDVAEVCENLYSQAGKCEAGLPYGTVYQANNNACNYMEGIKIVRKDGTVVTVEAKANKTASIFIGIFVVAFVLLSAYVYFLKTKLDRASINLAE